MMVKTLQDFASPSAVVAIRWTSFAICLWSLFLIPRTRNVLQPRFPEGWDKLKALCIGICCVSLSYCCYSLAVKMTTTIEANVLSASYPVVMGVLAFLFLHEKVKLQRWISIAVGVLGTYIVAVGFGLPKLDSSNSIGNLIFLGGLILECMALTMATRIILRSSGLGTLVFEATGAAIGSVLYSFLFPSFFSLSVKSFGWPQIAMMAYLVLIGGIFAFGVWYVFVEKAPVSLMMLSTLIQPPLAALLGFCILKEEIGFKTLVGTLIIAVSLVIAAFDRHSKLIPPSPQELEPI